MEEELRPAVCLPLTYLATPSSSATAPSMMVTHLPQVIPKILREGSGAGRGQEVNYLKVPFTPCPFLARTEAA